MNDTLLYPTATYNTSPYSTLLHPTTPLIPATVIPLPPSTSSLLLLLRRRKQMQPLAFSICPSRPLPFSRAFLGTAHEMHPPSLSNVLSTSLSNVLASSLSLAPHPQPPQREQREGARGRGGGGHTRDQVRGLAEEVRWSINWGDVTSGLFGTCPRRTVYLFTEFRLV